MQLLQMLRDSYTLESIVSEVSEVEKQARAFSNEIFYFLNQVRGELILYSYTGYGQLPASIFYWFSITAKSQKHPVLADVEDAAVYIAPYRDDVSALILSTGEYSKLISGLQAFRTLGVEYRALAPETADERISAIIKHYSIRTIPYKDKIKAALLMTLLSFFASSSIYKNALASRGQRLLGHSSEGFSCTIASFIEKYFSTVESLLKRERVFLASSKFLEPASLLLTNSIRRAGVLAEYRSLEEAVSSNGAVLGIFLSTEERVRREYASLLGDRLIELLFNTDPLEAGVYIALLAYILSRLIEEGRK